MNFITINIYFVSDRGGNKKIKKNKAFLLLVAKEDSDQGED